MCAEMRMREIERECVCVCDEMRRRESVCDECVCDECGCVMRRERERVCDEKRERVCVTYYNVPLNPSIFTLVAMTRAIAFVSHFPSSIHVPSSSKKLSGGFP